MDATLNFGSQPTSDNVDSVIPESGTADNMGVKVVIAAPSPTVQKLFPLPVSVAAILNSVDGRRHEMSGDVGRFIFKSGLVEYVGVEVEIASLSQAVQRYCRFRVYRRHLGFPAEGNVGCFSGMAPLKSSYPKMGGG